MKRLLPTEPTERKEAWKLILLGVLICVLAMAAVCCIAFQAVLLNTSFFRKVNDKYDLQTQAGVETFGGYLEMYSNTVRFLKGDAAELDVTVEMQDGSKAPAFTGEDRAALQQWRTAITWMQVVQWTFLAAVLGLVLYVLLRYGRPGARFAAMGGCFTFLLVFAVVACASYAFNMDGLAVTEGNLQYVLGPAYFTEFYDAVRKFTAFMMAGPFLLEMLLLKLAAKKNRTEEDDYLYQ